jgi:16S rRNA (uracil1498-N3)-methyltransferase
VGVVEEVCKQCQELHFPEVAEPKTLACWLAERDASRALVLCDENARVGGAKLTHSGVDLLVGAEGGWSEEEVEQLRAAGATGLGLGRNRLRAETATLVALALVKQRLGEIGS